MKTAVRLGIIGSILLMVCTTVHAQIPAFPGAEGFGAYANGGRGGDVYTVVNLNSSGPGSLRYGIENAPASGRTIVFAVSGYIPINYNSDTGNQTVRIVQDNVTIAGQTAPGDGIGLKDGRLLITGTDVVVRHIRVRHGKYGAAGDCINLDSSAVNSIIDHVSMMFSTDENISFFESSLNNFTMQYCTSSWGMERHNAGGLWDLDHGTCHHSLWAHHRTRNPKARPDGLLEWINNVTFAWGNEGFIMGDSASDVDWYANVIGCYYLWIPNWYDTSPDTTPLSKASLRTSDGQPNFHIYLGDSWIDTDNDGYPYGSPMNSSNLSGSPDIVGSPFAGAPVPVTTDAPLEAYYKVISSAGALRLDATYTNSLRDELDTLLIESVMNQESILVAKDSPTTSDPDEPPSNGEQHLADEYGISNNGFGTLNTAPYPDDTDGDGMPDYWEDTLGWNAAVQDHNTAMPNAGGVLTGLSFFPAGTPAGYTRLEEYLHFKAIPHASIAVNSHLDVDLRRYTEGFEFPAFYISNVSNATAVLQPDGYTVRITPTTNFSGRCRFDFMVEDTLDYFTWTQTFGLLVSAAFVPPDAPSNLNATAVSSYQIDLDWQDNSSNEGGFRIERSTDGTNFNLLATVSANVTNYSDGSLPPDTTYFYRVLAFNSVADSAYTSVASDTTFAGPPSPPTGLAAAAGDGQVTLSWNSSPGATDYILKRSTTSGGPYTDIATNPTPGYVDNSVVNQITYFYVVSAVNGYGEGDVSSQVSATPSLVLRINSGGPLVSPYLADTYYTGGSTYTNTGSINSSDVDDPAPNAVYQTERHGNFTYTIPGLVPGRDYLLRLHFDDIYHSSSGLRTFNVYINGTQLLSSYDIVGQTGARYKAVVHEFIATADGSGQIGIEYETVLDNALASGIEVLGTAQGSETIQVEDVETTYGGGVTLDSNNSGFHVTAFANFPTSGGYVQFNNVDGGGGGPAELIVRFALGNTPRTGNLIVNGSTSSIEFGNTGTFTTWNTTNIPIMLGAGATNTIRFESTGMDLANIDEIRVIPTAVSIPPVTAPVDPVAYYRFEEGTPGADVPVGSNTVVDTAGGDDNMAVDSTGVAPTYAADVPASPLPQTGESNAVSALFDGSDFVYSAMPSSPLNTNTFVNITVETYVKFTDLGIGTYQTIIGRDDTVGSINGQDGNPESLFYLYKHPDNTLRVEASTVGGDWLAAAGSVVVTTGTWYHVAAVGDVTSGTLTLFVDGTNVGSTAGYDGLFDPAENNPWTIGRGQYGGVNGFDELFGYVDEVRITSAALPSFLFLNVFNPDFDDDGLEDAWERYYFGDLSQGPADDPDGDDLDNATEEMNGTDPTVSNIPPVIEILLGSSQISLSWPSNHTGWILEYCTNLMEAGTNWIAWPGSIYTNMIDMSVDTIPSDEAYFQLTLP